MALVDKPANALDARGEKVIPVIDAADLEEQLKVPAVRERLVRVEALVEARRKARESAAGERS